MILIRNPSHCKEVLVKLSIQNIGQGQCLLRHVSAKDPTSFSAFANLIHHEPYEHVQPVP